MTIFDATLPAAAYPFHRDRQPLRQEANRHVMTAHQATERRAIEIEHAGSRLAGGGRTATRRPRHVRVPGSHGGGRGPPGHCAMIEGVGIAIAG